MTAIGFGTAFAMLLLLMVVILVGGWLLRVLESRSEERAASADAPPSGGRAHDKALAATVAVTTMLAERDRQGKTDDG